MEVELFLVICGSLAYLIIEIHFTQAAQDMERENLEKELDEIKCRMVEGGWKVIEPDSASKKKVSLLQMQQRVCLLLLDPD